MEPFVFIHAADLHLDRGFRGIGSIRPELGSRLAGSTFESYDRIIDLCIEHEARFLVISGDVYEDQAGNLAAQNRFIAGLERLGNHGISSFIAHGNHDPLNRWYQRVSWPDSAHRFGGEQVEHREALHQGRLFAVVSGISYPEKAVFENLARRFTRCSQAPFQIGVLHCSLGKSHRHENYAPCSLEDLRRAGIDYWALGHVHQPRVINESNPVIVYPGCSQGLVIGDTGPRGCYLVKVSSAGTVDLRFIETCSFRWETIRVDIDGMATVNEFIARVESALALAAGSGGRSLLARLEAGGRGQLHYSLAREHDREEVFSALLEKGLAMNPPVYLEKLIDSTGPPLDSAGLRREENLLAGYLNLLDDASREGRLPAELEVLLERLYHSSLAGGLLEPPFPKDLPGIISGAESIGIDNLLGEDLP